MSSGSKQMIINQRERAVSDDLDRLQAFLGQHRNELFRRLMCTRPNQAAAQPLENGSYMDTVRADTAAITSPLSGDVFEGLVVMPENGSLRLLVSPGVVGLDDPDGQAGSSEPTPASADDSRYKLVVSAGLQTYGVIAMSAGSGGATRIDVIECQRKTSIIEQDNRDEYDPVTGLFSGVLLNKVKGDDLQFRVRQGTPGAGLPAAAQGWLPLAVASVPAAATSNDTITFWDVRPLVKDRWNAPYESYRLHVSPERDAALYADDHTVPGKTVLAGFAVSSIGIYRAGGILPAGPNAIDAQATTYREAGFVAAPNLPWFFYVMFPGNLPRWVRYTDAPASPRAPSGCLGIPVVSTTGPASQFGSTDTRNPPASTGLVTSGGCALLGAGWSTGGGAPQGFLNQCGMTFIDPNGTHSIAPDSTTLTTDHYLLQPNGDFPETARSVLVRIATSFAGTAGTTDFVDASVMVMNPGGTSRVAQPFNQRFNYVYLGGGSVTIVFTCEIPVQPFGTLTGESTDQLAFQVEWNNAVSTRSSKSCSIIGWRL